MKRKGIIFDFNGTLLWDTQLHNRAWDNFLKNHGFSLSDEEKHQRIHGRLNSDILKDLFESKLTREEIERYALEKEYEYQRLCKEIDEFSLAEGVIELFNKLKEQDIPFVIATASGIENVEFYIRELELNKWFKKEHIVYNDGSMRGKPLPDLFLRAMDILGIEGEDTIIFEDSISGIRAAEAAGAGKVIIVDSNSGEYNSWVDKYTIITHFHQIDYEWFNK
ncbi:HAD family hydrolase [Halanaerobium saccharolyticum]|nr:HAD family phosphatase [Halanaerobium saccharolyticum]